jgi:hypothetical protein
MKGQKPSITPPASGEAAEAPDPEHLERFRKVMTALVAVPKGEAFRAFVKKQLRTPKRLDSKGRIVDLEPAKPRRKKKS